MLFLVDPSNSVCYRHLAMLMAKYEDKTGAMDYIRIAEKLEPISLRRELSQSLLKRLEICEMFKDENGILAALDDILVISPCSELALRKRVVLHMKAKQYNSAIRDLKQLLAVIPGDLPLIQNLASCHHSLGDFSEFLATLQRAVLFHPDQLTLIAKAEHSLGYYFASLESLKVVFQQTETTKSTPTLLLLYDRASAKLGLFDLEGALVDLKQADSMNPGNPAILDMMQGIQYQIKVFKDRYIDLIGGRGRGIEKVESERISIYVSMYVSIYLSITNRNSFCVEHVRSRPLESDSSSSGIVR